MRSKWDGRYLDLAATVATWSKDPSTQVGAVIVSPVNRVIAVGFNGFPTGVKDDDRLEDRDLKYELIIHGEMNAIITAGRDLHGFSLYTHPFLPCARCAAVVIQAGISRVVAPVCRREDWIERLSLSRALLWEANVEIVELA